ncbi:MAG TPA: c-type cytochrome [Candidatus Binatia bacterium]|jgi:mono/diheme cytochrome c family protein
MTKWIAGAVLALGVLAACDKRSDTPVAKAGEGDPKRGRAIYLTTCAACHNNDPSKDGAIGPAIKGSSKELVEARVLRAAYPPGYTPKRRTTMMPAQPDLKPAIPDIVAFLR